MELDRNLPIVNAMEPIVKNFFQDQFLKPGILKCHCSKCQLDILLLALNQLTPRYTSTTQGEAYIKAIYMNAQMQSDVLKELTKAVSVIEANPNH
ncbi:late competence development ComFB family protein [Cohnella kolymensis]|nr:late competence development ComFB family protein [Cohnella kolymensis]